MSASVLALLLAVSALGESGDVKQRVRDVRELGKGGSESIARIEPSLRDPESPVRLEAVKALVQIGTQRSLDPLIRAAGDNDAEIQIQAVNGLVNFYVPGYVKSGMTRSVKRAGSALKSMFNDRNDQVIEPYVEVRPEVIRAIGRVASGGASMESRANAALGAGILRGKPAVPDLLQALQSKDNRVIYESLVALQKIRDESAGAGVRFLLRDLDDRIRVTAIETSGVLRDHGAVNDLRDALDRSRSDKVKHAAMTSLAEIADPSTHALFKAYFTNKDEALRTGAAEGLARLRNDADGAVIEKAYNAEDAAGPRLADAFALVRYGSTDLTTFGALRYLVNQLNSANGRDAAIAYLIEASSGDAMVRKALYPVLQEAAATKAEKTGLAKALAASGDRETLPYLQTLSNDPDPDVAQAGLQAVRNLNARL